MRGRCDRLWPLGRQGLSADGAGTLESCGSPSGSALAVGLVKAFFVVYFDNDPFIVTLGTMTIVQGIIYIISGDSLILPAYAAVFLGATAIKPGRINPLGAFVAVYFLATGTAGLELLGAQDYVQQIFYGAALVVAITIPKATRRRILKRKQLA
jgi:ribose/xylose/arabinose/galactoside ABC-type transport system permease subunit